MRSGSVPLFRFKDSLLVAFFLIFWLVPILYRGLVPKRIPFLPNAIADFHSVACLFTKQTSGWSMYYVQVQSEDGGKWRTLPDRQFFQMNPFGYENRFYRLMQHSRKGKRAKRRLRELAAWFREQYARLHPHEAPLHAVRFLRAVRPVHEKLLPKQKWEKMLLRHVPKKALSVVSTHKFEGDSPRPVPGLSPGRARLP